jgi:uncharacterized YigZ family protein
MKYKTIETEYSSLYKEKASKFFALLFPIKSEEEAKNILVRVKKEYYDSRHVCYAYILGNKKEIWRLNDAGEPSNTAGKPILGQLTAFDITNALLIVVRYFGGTKLGVGGLIQAYKTAAQLVLEKAVIVEKDVLISYEINAPYENLSLVLKCVKSTEGKILLNEQNEECRIICEIPYINQQKFTSALQIKNITLKENG